MSPKKSPFRWEEFIGCIDLYHENYEIPIAYYYQMADEWIVKIFVWFTDETGCKEPLRWAFNSEAKAKGFLLRKCAQSIPHAKRKAVR